MIRLNMVVEGQTEETFVNTVLAEYLGSDGVYASVRCVETSRKRGRKFRGGLPSYAKAKNDIQKWMKEDQKKDAWFTTMFDLYALPDDFPGFDSVRTIGNSHGRIQALEEKFLQDMGHPRFIPYIQLHEFEALLLADPSKFILEFPGDRQKIEKLIKLVSEFETPEHINDDQKTAPSKRIIKLIPRYKGRKTSSGPNIAKAIGLGKLRERCSHFNQWISRLELLPDNPT